MMIKDPKQLESSPRAEVLRIIQRLGSASVKDLEAGLGVTTTAVREQVAHLLREDFLQAIRVRGVIGRPYYVYSLTPKAQELFPKDYATLAQLLLEETLSMHGPEGLRALLNSVSRRMAEKLHDSTQVTELSQKLLGLVASLGQTGMDVSMVTVENDGGFVLKAHSCPYFDVALNHREICDMEQEMMAELLGPGVTVELSSRIVEGACACEFHVNRTTTQAEPLEFVERVTAE
ncbi:MAG: TrmB family transcriptional regulator [Chloroflexota bacterium]